VVGQVPLVAKLQHAYLLMILFITLNSNLVPLNEDLCNSNPFGFKFSVSRQHLLLFSSRRKICGGKKAVSPRSHPTSQHIYAHVQFVHIYKYIYAEI